MTKADLVEEVVRVADVSKKHAEIIVNTVFSSIIEALQHDDKIELRGFGSFRVRRRRSRQGRNPKTGDRVEVPEKRIPYFKPGKELKDLINADEQRRGRGAARACRRPAPVRARRGLADEHGTSSRPLPHRDVGLSDERPRLGEARGRARARGVLARRPARTRRT